MKFLDLVTMGLRNLIRRKSRTILTVLGVIIGAASIVIMLSLGFAMDKNFKTQLEGMGNLMVITVRPNWGYSADDSASTGEVYLNEKAVESFEKIPNVEAVMPMKDVYLRISTGRYASDTSVIGVVPEMMDTFGIKVGEGRALLEEDQYGIVLGAYVQEEFMDMKKREPWKTRGQAEIDVFNDKLVITKDMNYGGKLRQGETRSKLKKYKLSVVGKITDQFSENSWNSYMNIRDLEKIEKDAEKVEKIKNKNKNKNIYNSIKIKAKSLEDVEKIQEAVKNMGYQANSLMDYQKEMKKTSGMIQMVLGGIGAVSLLIAALGITNTMIMAIYERTREIGVMKVLGANIGDIKKLFLFEAGMIGFIGGLLGLLISAGGSLLLNKFLGGMAQGQYYMADDVTTYVSYIPVWLYGLALVFSVVIGVISGYLPARRAMKLSALSAIKNE